MHEPLGFAITQNKPYNTAPYKSQNYKSYSFPNTDRLNTNQKFTPSTKRPSSSYLCTHCKVPGHSYERCFKIHGYPVGFKGFKDKKFAASIQSSQSPQTSLNESSFTPSISVDQYNYLMEVLKNQAPDSSITSGITDLETNYQANLAGIVSLFSCSNSQWIIDSGATDHICNNLNSFSDFKSFTGSIIIPNGKRVHIHHIGTIILNSNITLHNVLHAPDFHFNLLSVTKLCSDLSSTIYFTHNSCFIQGHSLKEPPTLLGNLADGLYKVKNYLASQFSHSAHTAHTSTNTAASRINKAQLWHLRLGHIPFSEIKHVIPDCFVTDCINNSLCQICPAAKQTRLSFPTSSIKSTKPFQLLHIDLWGPYRSKTHNNCNQFVTIVDDYSRYTWTHLINYKSDIVTVMHQFFLLVETQFQTKVQKIRSDNAPELCEGQMKALLIKKGILHETSCVNTPQQNGVVERRHRHLLDTARALFFQAKLPIQYWGESLLCATYLINRMPLKPINFQTPYQLLFQHTPDFSILKTFGCLCYMTTQKQNRTKFDPRAIPCVFLGYAIGQKGYKVLDLQSHKIYVSRDVIFHELHFPYHLQSIPPTSFSSRPDGRDRYESGQIRRAYDQPCFPSRRSAHGGGHHAPRWCDRPSVGRWCWHDSRCG